MERSNAHLQQQLGKKDEQVTVSPTTTMDTLPLVSPPPSRETPRETLPAAPAAPDDPVRRPTRRHRWLLWPLLAAVVAALPLLPVEVWLPHMDLPSDDLSSTADPLPPLFPADVPSFLNATCLDSERRFPLVVTPVDPSVSIERVSEWVERNRDIVTGWLDAYGAVLLRGFAVEEAAQFERVAMAYTDRLDNIYLGTSPREPVTNSEFVFTASEFESWKVVPMHCEMSFLPRPPEHLFFFAKEMPPDMVGGESPLVDMRAVAKEMGEATRAVFERKGIRYVRAYPSARSSHPLDKYDPFKTKSYEAMFRHVPSAATDAAAVEAESRRQGFTPSWGPRGILKLTHETPAFRTHPRTGDEVWHNHLGVLHSAAWADEFAHAARHLRSARYAALSWLFYALDALIHRGLFGEAFGQHVTHRGGEPIAAEHVWHVRRLMWKHTLTAPWRQGDIILVDNFRLAHARMPFSTAGKRRLWAIWAKPPASLE